MTAPLRLTPQERALVAEAIAAGLFTLCPPAAGTVAPAGMTPDDQWLWRQSSTRSRRIEPGRCEATVWSIEP